MLLKITKDKEYVEDLMFNNFDKVIMQFEVKIWGQCGLSLSGIGNSYRVFGWPFRFRTTEPYPLELQITVGCARWKAGNIRLS